MTVDVRSGQASQILVSDASGHLDKEMIYPAFACN